MSEGKMSSMDEETQVNKEKQNKEKKKLKKAQPEKGEKASWGKSAKKPLTAGNRLLLLALAALLFLLGGLVGTKALMGATRIEERPQYQYMLSVDGAYQVQLLPNELYPEQRMEEGRIYATALVDVINFEFTALYESAQRAEVRGLYSVEVLLQGHQGGEAKEIVYERTFSLMRDREVTGADNAKINVQLPVNMKPYYDFAQRAESILEAKLVNNIEIIFYGTFFSDTDYGSVEEPFSYRINVPYGDGLFALSKPAPMVKQGSIGETAEVTEHPNIILAVPACLLLLAAAALVVYVLRFARKPTAEEQLRFDWQSILRKHGSRMIHLESLPLFLQKEAKGEVFDLASLVKMADELRVPIYYSLGDQGLPAAGILYVEDRERVYFWQMAVNREEQRDKGMN